MDLRTFLLYLVTWTAVALTPGPAVIYSMATATRSGLRAAVGGICGIQAGNLVLFGAVAMGLGALLKTSTAALSTLRIAGALYLFWLGIGAIMRSFKVQPGPNNRDAAVIGKRSAIEGLLVQVTNPKALLFVTALLPQFLNATGSPLPQLALLVVATISVDALVLFSYAFAAHRGATRFRQSSLRTWGERFYGFVLLCFGGRLLGSRK